MTSGIEKGQYLSWFMVGRDGDELKTAPQQGKALELSFHCFPWLIKKESTNYNWEEDLDVRA